MVQYQLKFQASTGVLGTVFPRIRGTAVLPSFLASSKFKVYLIRVTFQPGF
jgi:hypothetical protein